MWGIVTLLGIIIITFLIVQLTPGDPASLKISSSQAASGQKLALEIIEETRRLYGLDKPILLNFNIKGQRDYIKSITVNKTDTSSMRNKISKLGTSSIPILIDMVHSNKIDLSAEEIHYILIMLTCNWNPPKELTEKVSTIEEWEVFLYRNLNRYKPAYIREIFWTYIHSTTPAEEMITERVLIDIGTIGLPVWMPDLLKLKTNKEFIPMTQILGKILDKPWRLDLNANKQEKERIYRRWKDWWNENKHLYTEMSKKERLMSIFTQTRFFTWFSRVLTLEFGDSFYYRRPVMDLLKERLPVTLQLNILSFFFIYLFSIPLGVFSATHQDSVRDKIVTILLFILYSLPTFWVAEMLILFTSGGSFLDIFPSHYLHSPDAEDLSRWAYLKDWAWHLILPVFCLTYGGIAYISKQMRAGMLESIRQDYIRTALAKGLPYWIAIYKHALRNALIPIITLLGYLLPALLGGSVIIEEIFSLNGVGKLSFEAVFNRDYPVVMTLALISAVLTLIGLFISDVLYVIIDPRISFED